MNTVLPDNSFVDFQSAYLGQLRNVLFHGQEVNVRGLQCKEIVANKFAIFDPRDRLLSIPSRDKKMHKYIFGELLWYLSGCDKVEFISKYSKFWKPLSDDGVHNNSAYGKYIFGSLPVKGCGVNYVTDPNADYYSCSSQWEWVKSKLKEDPSTRQAVIHIKPIQMYDTKDYVCTMYLQFLIRNDKLDLIVNMRSNDLMFGTTYDVFMFTFLQELMAKELGIPVGIYYHFTGSMHIYDRDYDTVKQILAESSTFSEELLPEIPKNFRCNEVPALLLLEEAYWKDIDEYNKLKSTMNLSNLSLKLLTFLEE